MNTKVILNSMNTKAILNSISIIRFSNEIDDKISYTWIILRYDSVYFR